MNYTFAELLKGFRKRININQEALAKNLNVSRNTVINWERGEHLPGNREMVLRIAEELYLLPAETDQLLFASEYPLEWNTVLSDQRFSEEQQFEERYRTAVIRELDKMEMFGIGLIDNITRKQRLSMAYITLSATHRKDNHPEHTRYASEQLGKVLAHEMDATFQQHDVSKDNGVIPVDEMLTRCRRLVIRGNAGAGKTTLLRWLAVRAAQRNFPLELARWNDAVPFFIGLRRLVDKEFPPPEQFPGLVHRNHPQIPENWVHRLLDEGRALVLVDGMDELPREQRITILDDLARLVEEFPEASYIISSRPAGLKDEHGKKWQEWETWTTGEQFLELMLEPMSTSNVEVFIDKWHEALSFVMAADEMSPVETKHLADKLKRLLHQRTQLRRLTINPLLCAMICTLHQERQENLPAERIRLYEQCIEMLLEGDQRRKIKLDLDETYPAGLSYDQKLIFIQDFAFWMMQNNYSEIERNRADDRFDRLTLPAKVKGTQIRRFFVDRASLLRESVEGWVSFLHRTFQEYLAAQQAIDEDCVGVLLQHAHDDQWREAIIVAAGTKNTKACEQLLRGLLQKGKAQPEHRKYLRLLAVACLETAIKASSELRKTVIQCANALLPPKDDDEVRLFAAAGDPIVPLLAPHSCYDEDEAALCVEALAKIGSNTALNMLAEYASDNRDRDHAGPSAHLHQSQ